MNILETSGWSDYTLLDSGNGYRLERFGPYILKRPDPQCVWKPSVPDHEWRNSHAVFDGSGSGRWRNVRGVPASWFVRWQDLSFHARLAPFKHTGIFPEQSVHWEWMREQLKKAKTQPNILNLFAYTGAASLVAAAAGAKVTHVDASKPSIGWARENQMASRLDDRPIRWILDDAVKFVQREVKRGVRYDGIIMDPPVYGHGPGGERWSFLDSWPHLLSLCRQVLSERPLFVIVNAYAVSVSSIMLANVMEGTLSGINGTIDYGELAMRETSSAGRLLSTGLYARWSR
jgi:23S rRNA (cytosine1962-C5)-methyltransferase